MRSALPPEGGARVRLNGGGGLRARAQGARATPLASTQLPH